MEEQEINQNNVSPQTQDSATSQETELSITEEASVSVDESLTQQETAVDAGEAAPEPATPTPQIPQPSSAVSAAATGGILLKTSHLVIGAVLALILIAGGFFMGFLLSGSDDAGMRVDPGAKPYGNVQALPGGSESGISVPMFDKVIFPADDQSVQMVLLNPEGNPCYFRYTLTLSDSGEVLYQSGLIPPGMAVTDLELQRSLPMGEYSLDISVETFSLDEERAAMNGTRTTVKLYCK